jgi:hypothetical protein
MKLKASPLRGTYDCSRVNRQEHIDYASLAKDLIVRFVKPPASRVPL